MVLQIKRLFSGNVVAKADGSHWLDIDAAETWQLTSKLCYIPLNIEDVLELRDAQDAAASQHQRVALKNRETNTFNTIVSAHALVFPRTFLTTTTQSPTDGIVNAQLSALLQSPDLLSQIATGIEWAAERGCTHILLRLSSLQQARDLFEGLKEVFSEVINTTIGPAKRAELVKMCVFYVHTPKKSLRLPTEILAMFNPQDGIGTRALQMAYNVSVYLKDKAVKTFWSSENMKAMTVVVLGCLSDHFEIDKSIVNKALGVLKIPEAQKATFYRKHAAIGLPRLLKYMTYGLLCRIGQNIVNELTKMTNGDFTALTSMMSAVMDLVKKLFRMTNDAWSEFKGLSSMTYLLIAAVIVCMVAFFWFRARSKKATTGTDKESTPSAEPADDDEESEEDDDDGFDSTEEVADNQDDARHGHVLDENVAISLDYKLIDQLLRVDDRNRINVIKENPRVSTAAVKPHMENFRLLCLKLRFDVQDAMRDMFGLTPASSGKFEAMFQALRVLMNTCISQAIRTDDTKRMTSRILGQPQRICQDAYKVFAQHLPALNELFTTSPANGIEDYTAKSNGSIDPLFNYMAYPTAASVEERLVFLINMPLFGTDAIWSSKENPDYIKNLKRREKRGVSRVARFELRDGTFFMTAG